MTKAHNYRHLGRTWQSRPALPHLNLLMATILAALPLLAPRASAGDEITVLRGSMSTRDPAELNYVQSATDRVSTWLDQLGLPHRVLEDSTLSRSALTFTRVLILPYSPTLPRGHHSTLKTFLRRGGKIIVFYSSDAKLADMLGLRLGSYALEKYPQQWSSMHFVDPSPRGVPSVIAQTSRNIRPVYPHRRDARIIARWHDDRERPQKEPAWVISSDGAWMTHILLDGVTRQKQQLLLGLIAHFYPAALEQAATHALRTIGRMGPYRDYDDFTRTIRHTPMPKPLRATVSSKLSEIERFHALAEEQYRANDYAAVLKSTQVLDQLIVDVYARSQPSRVGEVRALWEHSGMGLHPGNWSRTMRTVAHAGFTDLLTNMLWPGQAHFESRVTPPSDAVALHGDQLAQCIRAARSNGIRVHLWKICWNLERASAPMVRKLMSERRLQQTHNGATVNWLCPSHPKNRDLEIEAIADALRRYDLDGLHLDYIRYKDSTTCYCDTCRAEFEKRNGSRVHAWPRDVRSGILKDQYNDFRRETITTFVARVKETVREIRPKTQLSAAVYGSYPSCRTSIAQDWAAWISKDLVDVVYPMNYVSSTQEFLTYLKRQVALPRATGRIYPGIGVTASESRLDAVATIEQIQAARAAGAGGFALYELNGVLREEILPVLRLGTTRP
ncbi:MAG: family 10 glycosylhydrolase [Verrucomicrobia bacterium]|nr:family 10 glycosylhydrolase [Verrucomicrobiota bacterium]